MACLSKSKSGRIPHGSHVVCLVAHGVTDKPTAGGNVHRETTLDCVTVRNNAIQRTGDQWKQMRFAPGEASLLWRPSALFLRADLPHRRSAAGTLMFRIGGVREALDNPSRDIVGVGIRANEDIIPSIQPLLRAKGEGNEDNSSMEIWEIERSNNVV